MQKNIKVPEKKQHELAAIKGSGEGFGGVKEPGDNRGRRRPQRLGAKRPNWQRGVAKGRQRQNPVKIRVTSGVGYRGETEADGKRGIPTLWGRIHRGETPQGGGGTDCSASPQSTSGGCPLTLEEKEIFH